MVSSAKDGLTNRDCLNWQTTIRVLVLNQQKESGQYGPSSSESAMIINIKLHSSCCLRIMSARSLKAKSIKACHSARCQLAIDSTCELGTKIPQLDDRDMTLTWTIRQGIPRQSRDMLNEEDE